MCHLINMWSRELSNNFTERVNRVRDAVENDDNFDLLTVFPKNLQ